MCKETKNRVKLYRIYDYNRRIIKDAVEDLNRLRTYVQSHPFCPKQAEYLILTRSVRIWNRIRREKLKNIAEMLKMAWFMLNFS